MALKRAASGYDYIDARTGEWASSVAARRQTSIEREVKTAAQPIIKIVERVHPQELEKRRRALVNCAMILSVFALMVFMIGRYADISTMHLENLEAEERIEMLEAQVRTLNLEIAAEGDIYTVETRAEEELGMGFPSNDQVRYVTLPELPAATPMAADGDILDSLFGGAQAE